MPLSRDKLLQLFIAHRVMLSAYIRVMAGRKEVVEDVLQNLCVVLMSKEPQVNDEDHFRAWIRRAARLETLTLLRRVRREAPLLDDELMDLLEPHWRKDDDAQSDDAALLTLRGCLQRLSEGARKIMNLRYQEERSPGEIAALLNRTPASFYVSLTRIHKTLAECMQVHGCDEGSS